MGHLIRGGSSILHERRGGGTRVRSCQMLGIKIVAEFIVGESAIHPPPPRDRSHVADILALARKKGKFDSLNKAFLSSL